MKNVLKMLSTRVSGWCDGAHTLGYLDGAMVHTHTGYLDGHGEMVRLVFDGSCL